MESMMGILGLMQGLQGSQMGASGQNTNGLDVMKILPLLSALKGGFPMGNTPKVDTQSTIDNDFTSQNTPPTENAAPIQEKTEKGGYKDKYSAISFKVFVSNDLVKTIGKFKIVRAISVSVSPFKVWILSCFNSLALSLYITK